MVALEEVLEHQFPICRRGIGSAHRDLRAIQAVKTQGRCIGLQRRGEIRQLPLLQPAEDQPARCPGGDRVQAHGLGIDSFRQFAAVLQFPVQAEGPGVIGADQYRRVAIAAADSRAAMGADIVIGGKAIAGVGHDYIVPEQVAHDVIPLTR